MNEQSEDELCTLVGQLLSICIQDPGLHNSRDASTYTGQHLRVRLNGAIVFTNDLNQLFSLKPNLNDQIFNNDYGVNDDNDLLCLTQQDISINRHTLTEALRLYFISRDKESAIFQWVSEKPFLALNPTQKSEVRYYSETRRYTNSTDPYVNP